MTSKDQTKVMNKGFTIIRADLFRLAIKFKDKNNLHWKIYECDFESKAAVERRMKELLKQSDFIED